MSEKIELEFKGDIIKGVLIKEDKEYITVKLSSGYNANLKKSEIKEIKRLRDEEIKGKKQNIEKHEKKELSKITIIHTGGTIASKVDYRTGAVSSKFTPDELLNLYPELNELAQIDAKMIGNLFSEDMRFAHYNLMLKEIELAIKNKTCGIIISHGTDTMHYTSSALQYACKNLSVPVILVGAQRSSDRASSDGYSNLEAAVNFIISTPDFRRVGICMHGSISDNEFLILDAINAKKMHSTRRDAFKQINYLSFAKIHNKKQEILRPELLSKEVSGKFSFTTYNEKLKIGFFKAHPNLFADEIKMLSIYDAVIVEGTGLGHLAVNVVDDYTSEHKKNLDAVKELVKKTKVIMGVQTIYGETNLNIYSTGRDLQKVGVIGNYLNLTTEVLFIRTAFCMSQKEKKFEDIWEENLEGFEIKSLEIEES